MSETTSRQVTKKLFITHYKHANDKVVYKKSWDDFPQLKEKLSRLTLEYKNASLELRSECGSDNVIHNTVATMNGRTDRLKGISSIDLSVQVGNRLTSLANYTWILINKYNIYPYLVHRTKDELLKLNPC